MAFPANPIYASKDFVNWRLASNAVNRVSQFPIIRSGTQGNGGGMFANTLRYHNGTFYLISTWASEELGGPRFVMFTSRDPFDDLAWSDAIWPRTPGYTIDPDIFFDDDGSVVVASAGAPIIAAYLDLSTGNTSEPWELWGGTGGASAEGPHLYKKDGYYYLLIAEGGTQLNHSATIARSMSLRGPWEAAPANPLVSNKNTDEYFQTVGHADLFQDSEGNWWGVALSTLSWPEGSWPIADQVKGQMSGPLPEKSSIFRGLGPSVGEADIVDFEPGSALPSHWVHWRAPFDANDFAVSPKGFENTLRLTASRANLTTDAKFNASTEGVTAVFRRQEHTIFNFTADIHLGFGKSAEDEVGVSNFGTPNQHVDVGVVYLEAASDSATTFRLRANGLVIFLDTWLDKPSILPKYLDIDEVTEADYIFISHAHFDHLPGADRIAKKTGAMVIANGEAINLLRSAGVHESQLLPVAGGERIPLFTKADRDAATAGEIPLTNGPPGAPPRPHHSRAVISAHVWPSLHAMMPGSGHHDIPDEIDTGTEYTGEATPYACTLDVTMGMKYGLLRLKDIVPPEHMDKGMVSFAEYIADRERHVFSHYDGGQLAFNFLIGPGKTLFWNGHLGGYEGLMKTIEPAPDVAILAIAGRANLNGRPYNGSAASFAVEEIKWLSQPKKVIWCLHDEGAIKPFRVNTAAATAMVHAETSTKVDDLSFATPARLF
ncbi:xylosidase arabinofuranosidase [Colletotrichum karsti]|uniref:Xylosidase arabinofuranosidase n=1 Tax=Colletotrichum karsti TaxID=1095194 RepID=A0A9P6HU55_9PEZI|nr:xylosidase arabinofuranosidase [Colletotrichum karsti]KAF9870753.1 xylosidase arabinofuranosidase [Colletotrichum karsti]